MTTRPRHEGDGRKTSVKTRSVFFFVVAIPVIAGLVMGWRHLTGLKPTAFADYPNGPGSSESSSRETSPNIRSTPIPLTNTEVSDRVARGIVESMRMQVEYLDVLGEGEQGWDSDPTYHKTRTNCILWLESVIADVYGKTDADKIQVMNRLRYYGGHIGFGMRKHFIDHWMTLESAPFKQHVPAACRSRVQKHEVTINPALFKESVGYDCPLYREAERSFSLDYLPPDEFVSCARNFEPGYYVIVAVASDAYLKRYGQTSGPMGYVHSLFLEVAPQGELIMHHASILSGTVKRDDFPDYIRRTATFYNGFMAYRLDPAWDWRSNPGVPEPFRAEAEKVLACERDLVNSGVRRDPAKDFKKNESPAVSRP